MCDERHRDGVVNVRLSGYEVREDMYVHDHRPENGNYKTRYYIEARVHVRRESRARVRGRVRCCTDSTGLLLLILMMTQHIHTSVVQI